ncbi:MAG: Rid family hydrolase [Marinicella sp.]
MKYVSLMICLIGLVACSSNPSIERTHYQDYEQQVGFTQVIQVGDRLIISGVVAPGPDMEQAVTMVYSSIKSILQKHGATMGDVIKENLYTTDMAAMRMQTATRKKYFPEGFYPAATWVEVQGLYLPEFILEVEVEAFITAEE